MKNTLNNDNRTNISSETQQEFDANFISKEEVRISRMLELSTAHIKESTSEWLRTKECPIAVIDTKYAWFIPVIENSIYEEAKEKNLIPVDLVEVIEFARSHNCRWINLDQDGPVIRTLPVYEW